VPAPDVLGAVAQDQEALARRPVVQEGSEEAEGRRVDPVQVLDDDDERDLGGHVLEHQVDGLMDALGGQIVGCAALTGQQARQRAGHGLDRGREGVLADDLGQSAEELADGPVRGHAARLEAVAHDDMGAIAELRGELGDEAGLADAGLAADEDGPPTALHRLRARHPERLELDLATDDHVADDGWHGRSLRRGCLDHPAIRAPRRAGAAKTPRRGTAGAGFAAGSAWVRSAAWRSCSMRRVASRTSSRYRPRV